MLSQLTTAQTIILIFGVIWLSSSFFHLFPSLMRQRSEIERFKGCNGFHRSHGEENDVLTFNNKETNAINSKFLKFREIEGQISEAEMEGIEHKMVAVNGINMHIAEKGQGPVVLMLHGFPELWYSWRHQIVTLAASGYRAVAPDLRGYGDTDAPPSFHSYTTLHIVGDLIALIDALGQDKVFVVGHDWGAMIAWCFCLYRPDRVKALVNLSVPFAQRKPLRKPIETYRAVLGHDYYICRFQEPGEIEAEIAEAGAYNVLKKLLTLRDPGPLIIPKKTWLEVSPSSPITLPSWLSEEDVNYFASKYEEKGFTGGLNYYRAMDLSWELTAAWTGVQVKVPVKFIVGDQDLVYNMPGRKEYIHGVGFKNDVPFLQEIVVIEGAALTSLTRKELKKSVNIFMTSYRSFDMLMLYDYISLNTGQAALLMDLMNPTPPV